MLDKTSQTGSKRKRRKTFSYEREGEKEKKMLLLFKVLSYKYTQFEKWDWNSVIAAEGRKKVRIGERKTCEDKC